MSYPALKKTKRPTASALSESLARRQQEAYDKHVRRAARCPKNAPPPAPALARPAAKQHRKTPAPASPLRPRPRAPPPIGNNLAVPKTRKAKTTPAPPSRPVPEVKPTTYSRPKSTHKTTRQKPTFVPPSRPVLKAVFPTVRPLKVPKKRQALDPLPQKKVDYAPLNPPANLDDDSDSDTSWMRYNTDGDLITDEVVAKMWPVRVPPSAHSQIDFLSKFAEKPAGVQEEEESQADEDDDWWQYLSSEEQEQQAQPATIEDSFQRWLDAPEEEVVSSVEPEPSLEDRLARLTMPSPISVPDVPQGHRSRQALSTSRPAWSILLPSYQMKLDRDAAAGFISRFKDDNADDDGETTGRPWDNDFALDPAARHLPALRQDRLPVRIPSLAALDAHLDAMNIPRSGYRRPRTAPSRSSVSASDKQSTVPSTAPPTTAISKASRIPAPAKKVRTRGRRHRFIFFH
ncbi:hypothetical protein HYQ45_003798 [Verticillium longisporum]|uniref:Uncharacterized protein n=1 Tax=Verticillium longisporum TaxID=100787 RepID=A0A8I2ZXG9_VERLO|nr:hypothetical protein HYQ45_003798 [Verticillium longisporum]